jgi:hypothetical protein
MVIKPEKPIIQNIDEEINEKSFMRVERVSWG